METSSKNMEHLESIERFKQLVEQHYRKQHNGQFEDCTKKVLPGEEIEAVAIIMTKKLPQNSTKCD